MRYYILVVQMSSVGECTAELFVFPIVFHTVSFHHRAEYQLHFSLSLPVLRLHPLRLLFSGEQREVVDRSGNAWNLDGRVSKQNQFCSSKFPIQYNDQIVKFKTGFLAGLAAGEAQRVRVNVQLMRLNEDGRGGKPVASELLEVCLGGEGEHMRRLVFSTNEYISYVDVAFQQTRIAVPSPLKPSLLLQYSTKVLSKLKFYQQLAARTARKAENLREAARCDPSFFQVSRISQIFRQRFVEREVSDLGYIRVKAILQPGEEIADSHSSLQPSDRIDSAWPGVVSLLCDHYQCEQNQLIDFITAEGKLLQLNIRAMFQRLAQLTIAMLVQDHCMLSTQEVTRIKTIISISQNHIKPRDSVVIDFKQDAVKAHRVTMKEFLSGLPSVTGSQMKQPYVQIRNMIGNKEWRGSIGDTLTVFIHGYKGNEYDLSKMKSHLYLLLGCVHFYSIKGLSAEKATEATIAQLGETAAKELLSHLALSPAYQRINFIGFSLGGLIARAMLPFLKAQRSRLGLLLTIATPHLGVREVQNCLVRAGLCYMRRVAGIEAIRQLNSERDSQSNRYLVELADGEGLEWFSSIVLVGSFDDCYVPAYSALAQYTGEDEVTRAIADRLGSSLSRAVRVAVQLEYSESLMDLITKRRSHISFLEDDSFIRHLLVRLRPLFACPRPE